MKLQFLNSISLDMVSGGNIYNHHVIDGLKAKNIEVDYKAIVENKGYNITVIDSLYMNKIPIDKLDHSKPIFALIHQVPELETDRLDFYKTYAKFIVTGKSAKQQLIDQWQINSENITIIRPGIPYQWKPKIVFNKTPKRVIVVSNLIAHKGFEMLIRILNRLTHLDLNFHIVGNNDLDKAYADKIVKAIQNTNANVEFHFNIGREDIYNQLMQSDIFLSLSESETFGMAIFEALSLGLPCIAYKTGDIDYFSQYQNYVSVEDYTPNSFLEIIEAWSKTPETYEQFYNVTLPNQRHWDVVIEEFYESLKNNASLC